MRYLALLILLIAIPAHAEMGYFKATEVVTSGIEYSQEIDYEYWVYVYDPISGETVFMPPPEEDKPKKEKKQKYKTTARPWIKHTMTIDPEASGSTFMSGVSEVNTFLGKDLKEVAELKRSGWKSLILHEMRIAWWDTSGDEPVFRRTTIPEWIDAGKPPYIEIHPWRKMSGVPNRGATYEQVMEVIE